MDRAAFRNADRFGLPADSAVDTNGDLDMLTASRLRLRHFKEVWEVFLVPIGTGGNPFLRLHLRIDGRVQLSIEAGPIGARIAETFRAWPAGARGRQQLRIFHIENRRAEIAVNVLMDERIELSYGNGFLSNPRGSRRRRSGFIAE